MAGTQGLGSTVVVWSWSAAEVLAAAAPERLLDVIDVADCARRSAAHHGFVPTVLSVRWLLTPTSAISAPTRPMPEPVHMPRR